MGIKGARIILERKFKRKIPVKKNTGPNCDINDGWELFLFVKTLSVYLAGGVFERLK